MECLLLPKAGMHGVPSLALLVIFPSPKDWTEGGAPDFKLPNPDKQPRINLVPKTGVLVYSRSDRVENQEYTPHILCLRRSSYALILFWILFNSNVFIIFYLCACVCVCLFWLLCTAGIKKPGVEWLSILWYHQGSSSYGCCKGTKSLDVSGSQAS